MIQSLKTGLQSLVPRAIRRRYLAKFAVIVAVVLLVTAGAGLYFQGQVTAELTEDVHTETETVASLQAAEMESWYTESTTRTRMLSELSPMALGSDVADTRLDAELSGLPASAHAIHYVNLTTDTIEASTDDDREGTTLADSGIEWNRHSLDVDLTSAVAVSDGYRLGDRALLAFGSPVPNADAAIILEVDVGERADRFQTPFDAGYTQVVADDGTTLFAADDEALLATYPDDGNASVLAAGTEGAGSVQRDATDEVVGYAPVENADWVVVTHAPQSEAYALRDEVTRDFVVLVSIALAGFLVVGFTLGRNTVRALDGLADRAEALARGDLDMTMDDTERIDEVGRAQAAFSDTKAYLGTVADQADALARQDFDDPVLDEAVPGALGESLSSMRADLEAFIEDLEASEAEAERARERAESLADSLETQAEEFSTVVERAADGDLTQRLDDDVDEESMRAIATAFNDMLDQLEATVVDIQTFGDDVATAADEVASGSREVRDAAEQVAESVEEISSGSRRQSENLREVSSEMTDLSATIEEVASSADEVAQVTQAAAERGAEGSSLAAASIERMGDIRSTTAETVAEIEALDEEMTRIGDVVDLIDDIAEQTNMLALNASIEAARAGEAGDGFGVVAAEIKSLAEETSQATDEIEALISEVQDSTTEATEDMREMRSQVAAGTEIIEDGLSALEDIVDHVEDANASVQSINEATDDQAASSQEVVTMVDDVASLSEEATAEAETVSAAAEEQAASVSQIAENARALTDQSAELQRLLSQFDARADAGGDELDAALDDDPALDDPALDDDGPALDPTGDAEPATSDDD